MKLIQFIILMASLILFISCEKKSNTLGSSSTFALNKAALKDLISIEFINYDSLVVKSADSIKLSNSQITSVELGEKDTGMFEPFQAAIPVYTSEGRQYSIDFLLTHRITNNRLRVAYFTIRFIFDDDSYADVDTFSLTYKFPYKSAEIFLKTNDITSDNLQDILILGDKLYFYNLGPTSLWEFDLNSSGLSEKMYFGSGDHIAGHSNYLFLDTYHCSIHRYNITEDTLDIHFDLSSFSNPDVRGLAVSSNTVYAMFPHSLPNESILAQFDFEGRLITTEPLPFKCYYLAIHDNILYTVDYRNNLIVRYDLNTKLLLPAKSFPAESIEGICIHDNHLYFIDYYKKLISKIDLDSFNSSEILNRIDQQIPLSARNLNYRANDRGEEVNK